MKWLWRWMTMNKTIEIYSALFHDLQTKTYDVRSRLHRQYTCENSLGIIYSLNVGTRMRALEIPVDNKGKNKHFPVWKGVKIEVVTMPDYSDPNQLYIELQQMPGTEAEIFEIVVDDLRRGIDAMPSKNGSTKTTIDRLKKWQQFFAAGKLPVLTGVKAQGLYGELLFLLELINDMGTEAVNYWSGIDNETHDFYIGQNAVEIKTTSTQAPYMAHINSEYQLDNNDVNGNLYLRMYAFRKDMTGGQRLPEIVKTIREKLKDDISAGIMFDEKINKAGYYDAAEDYYREGYTIREVYSFEVKNDFPRFMKRNVPNGVYNLEYSVAIAQCMEYAIEAKDLIRGIKK